MDIENNPNIRRDLTLNQCFRLINLINNINKKNLTKSLISKQLGISPSNPHYNKLMRYLEDIEIIKIVDIIGGSNIIEIDKDKLIDFIDEQNIINFLVDNYLNKYHTFKW